MDKPRRRQRRIASGGRRYVPPGWGGYPARVLRVRRRDTRRAERRLPTVYMRDGWRAVREPGPDWQGPVRLTCQDQSRWGARCADGPTRGESGEGHETQCEWGSRLPPCAHWPGLAPRVPGWAGEALGVQSLRHRDELLAAHCRGTGRGPPMEWRAARPAASGNGPLGGPVARETSQTKAPGVQWDGRWHPTADVGRLSPETVTRGGRLASITAR